MEKIIPITNGQGSVELVNGTYTVTSTTAGYDNTSVTPSEQEITEGVNEYSFTIAATGTLTLHVSDDGTSVGVPIEGATFIRCDASGATYGTEITSNADGEAVFNYVPFATENAPIIYYKQTASDGSHIYDDSLKNTTLTDETSTIEVANAEAPLRTFNFTDTNYENLPIMEGQITLSN